MNLPNKISIVRLLLTPIFAVSVIYCNRADSILVNMPLVIFLIAILSDAADGFIARRRGQITSLGMILDPIADKFLLAVAFIILAVAPVTPSHVRIPPWVLVIVLTRDLFILAGAAIIYMLFGYVEFKPSVWGKVTTFFQMMTIFAVLLRFKYVYIVWILAAVFTVASGAHYLLRANRILNGKSKHI